MGAIPDVAFELAHHAVVGDRTHVDQVETVHLFGPDVIVDQHLREVETHIENNDILARTDGRHLATDLLITADCCDFDFHNFKS